MWLFVVLLLARSATTTAVVVTQPSFNSLVVPSNTAVVKFTCNTTYDELIAMKAPIISLNPSSTMMPTTPTTPGTTNPTVAPTVAPSRRQGFFSIIWNFLCNLFRLRRDKVVSLTINTAPMTKTLLNNRTLFFGTEQVTSTNQNPIITVFRTDTKERLWCYNTYEIAGADGRTIGALYAPPPQKTDNGNNTMNDDDEEVLYVVFTIDGTQGSATEDFRRFTNTGWISSYGQGGGPKVSVLAHINSTTGAPMTGTFIKSQLPSNGNTNSLIVTELSYERRFCNITSTTGTSNDALVRVHAEAYYLPMSMDGKTPMTDNDCLPDIKSPFNYTVTFTPSLSSVYSTDCRRLIATTAC